MLKIQPISLVSKSHILCLLVSEVDNQSHYVDHQSFSIMNCDCIVTLKFDLEHYIVALEMSSGVMKILSQLLLKMAETDKIILHALDQLGSSISWCFH